MHVDFGMNKKEDEDCKKYKRNSFHIIVFFLPMTCSKITIFFITNDVQNGKVPKIICDVSSGSRKKKFYRNAFRFPSIIPH